MDGAGPRYAIYFAPDPESPLWRFGSACIGYDAQTGALLPVRAPLGIGEADWHAMTAEPRRYGFHATLKAPFHLRAGADEPALLAAMARFAAAHVPFELPGLRTALLGRFVALVPSGETPALLALAAAAVEAFEPFRAPLSDSDLARRRSAPLTARQSDYLDRWGYPYVFDEFRFHMTLTGPLDAPLREAVRADLERAHAAAVGEGPVALDAVALFRQDRRDLPFRILSRDRLSRPCTA